MPELPEVEILVRHLAPLLKDRIIRGVRVHRRQVTVPDTTHRLRRVLVGARFVGLSRRGKYLVFALRQRGQPLTVLGHLGMTGRYFLQPKRVAPPKHTAVCLDLGRHYLIYEDPRRFGRFTLDTHRLDRLGPEPLESRFAAIDLWRALQRSRQAVKVKLLDQSLVAGLGNIYASEALFRAGIAPALPACRLTRAQVRKLWRAIRAVLRESIRCGSTLPLNFGRAGESDGLFYFGRQPKTPDYYAERLRVYDRAGQPCPKCRTPIRRLIQSARSTFFCPRCQRTRAPKSGGKFIDAARRGL
jgi:formamidopyrimidine-DNA glycosylase